VALISVVASIVGNEAWGAAVPIPSGAYISEVRAISDIEVFDAAYDPGNECVVVESVPFGLSERASMLKGGIEIWKRRKERLRRNLGNIRNWWNDARWQYVPLKECPHFARCSVASIFDDYPSNDILVDHKGLIVGGSGAYPRSLIINHRISGYSGGFGLLFAREIQADGGNTKSDGGNRQDSGKEHQPLIVIRNRFFVGLMPFFYGLVTGLALLCGGTAILYRRLRDL
jgi:hypothetical protein